MTNPCQPNSQPLSITSPCMMLPLLRGALLELIGGKARSRVRFGDQELQFHGSNIAELRKEIIRLEAMCNANGTENLQGRAVQAGPRRLAGFVGNRPPYSNY